MRRFLTISLIILALAVSAAGVAPATHAQTTGGAPLTTQSGGTEVEGLGDAISDAAKLAAAKTQAEQGRTENASWGLNFVVSWIVKLFAWIVGVAALTLNYAMYYTVVGMGAYVSKLSAIGTVWRILRDIGNILLIFGFLAIGISYILDSEWYGGGKKLLPKLLIVAVFANFSLFAAEAMIDVGNLFATQIYKQISGGSLPELSSGAFGAATDVANERISTMILNKVGLQTLYGNGEVNTEIFEAGNSWLISFMSIILFVITAFVMFSLAFILISRFIVLILLIMVSPVGVAGLAVPGLQGWAKKWWDTLFQQTITAPILLLLLYIALSVITDNAFLTGFGVGQDSTGWIGWAKTATGTNNFGGLAQMMLSFLVAIGLLLAVVYFAKTLSAVGAGWATKTAGKLSFGATALGMRASGGWVSHRASERWKRSSLARVPVLGRSVSGVLDRGAKASFDMRGTSALKNLPGGSIDAGEAQKGGYKADLKARIESRTKYASELKGRELDASEKTNQLALQNQIKEKEKTRAKETDQAAIRILDQDIKVLETKLEELESVTDKGAQRKYATVLELGKDPKGRFNKYFNFAANTEAAKIIRAEAKKGKPDKDWTANMKKLLKEAGEGTDAEAAPATRPAAPAGRPPAAPTTSATPAGRPPTPGAGPAAAP